MRVGVILKCGCAAQGMGRKAGEPESARRPACVIHDCFEPAESAPNLTGRTARCAYFGKGPWRRYECNYARRTGCTPQRCACELPSDSALPFFEYRGPGSRHAAETCRHCAYYREAHERLGPKGGRSQPCRTFEPRGDSPDQFFCGCASWD